MARGGPSALPPGSCSSHPGISSIAQPRKSQGEQRRAEGRAEGRAKLSACSTRISIATCCSVGSTARLTESCVAQVLKKEPAVADPSASDPKAPQVTVKTESTGNEPGTDYCPRIAAVGFAAVTIFGTGQAEGACAEGTCAGGNESTQLSGAVCSSRGCARLCVFPGTFGWMWHSLLLLEERKTKAISYKRWVSFKPTGICCEAFYSLRAELPLLGSSGILQG